MVTVGGDRGVLVVGGATGDDVVEFLNWETRTEWVTLEKLNRGRGGSYNSLRVPLLATSLQIEIV